MDSKILKLLNHEVERLLALPANLGTNNVQIIAEIASILSKNANVLNKKVKLLAAEEKRLAAKEKRLAKQEQKRIKNAAELAARQERKHSVGRMLWQEEWRSALFG